jgi:CDP-glucose 4,6-dehydratase
MAETYAITGATGLLGSHLANQLISENHEVYALIKDEQSKSILSNKVTRVYGDINSKNDMDYFIQKSTPQIFVHLAAQTQAYDSLNHPYQTFHNNIVGTMNVLESLREYKKSEAIIVASSDKAYGELKGEKYKEEHQLKGIYPYDASKSAADIISNSYRETYGLPIVITRACNIYGIGDFNKKRIIPGVVNSFLTKEEFVIRNQGSDIREYINVNDVVSAYKLLIEYIKNTNRYPAFNISSNDHFSTIDLFELIEKTIGKEIKHKIINANGLEIKKQYLDSSLLIKETGWRPKHNLKDSIGAICDWYLNKFV